MQDQNYRKRIICEMHANGEISTNELFELIEQLNKGNEELYYETLERISKRKKTSRFL